MPDSKPHMQRASPLDKAATTGRFGADKGAPGIELLLRHPASIVALIARKDSSEPLAAALKQIDDCEIRWAGVDHYYAIAEGRSEGVLYQELKKRLGTLASVSDQSHGRIIIRIGGIPVRKVLAKGTAIDLHKDEFPLDKSAVTQMAHVGVHLTRTGEDSFELSVFRGFAESFWEWLAGQAAEFGYRVV